MDIGVITIGINLQGGGQPTPTGMYRNMKISTPKGM